MRATDTQQEDIKALAQAVLARNKSRNVDATGTEKACNKRPDNMPDLLHDCCAVSGLELDVLQEEYFRLLEKFWSIDNDPPGITDTEAERVLARLDALYQELHLQGRKVPVRLPVERNRHEQNQKEVAL